MVSIYVSEGCIVFVGIIFEAPSIDLDGQTPIDLCGSCLHGIERRDSLDEGSTCFVLSEEQQGV